MSEVVMRRARVCGKKRDVQGGGGRGRRELCVCVGKAEGRTVYTYVVLLTFSLTYTAH